MKVILQIWPVPAGHRSQFHEEKPKLRQKVHLADLIYAGLLEPGMPLVPRPKKHAHRVATLLPDGQIDLDGKTFEKPARAAAAITGKATKGMWFFLVDPASRRSLSAVRRQYAEALSVDFEEENGDDNAQVDD